MKKLTLARFLLRPIESFERTYKIFNSIDIKAEVFVKDGNKEEDLEPGGYVVYSGIAFPVETWRLIKPSLIKVDYNFTNNGKVWEIKSEQNIHVNVLTKDEMTALHVAKRFKDAS